MDKKEYRKNRRKMFSAARESLNTDELVDKFFMGSYADTYISNKKRNKENQLEFKQTRREFLDELKEFEELVLKDNDPVALFNAMSVKRFSLEGLGIKPKLGKLMDAYIEYNRKKGIISLAGAYDMLRNRNFITPNEMVDRLDYMGIDFEEDFGVGTVVYYIAEAIRYGANFEKGQKAILKLAKKMNQVNEEKSHKKPTSFGDDIHLIDMYLVDFAKKYTDKVDKKAIEENINLLAYKHKLREVFENEKER